MATMKTRAPIKKVQKKNELKKTVYDTSHEYRCLICGKSYSDPTGKFYKSQFSENFVANSKYVPYCVKCVDEMYTKYEHKYGAKTACIIMCYKLDIPFYHTLFDTILEKNNSFKMGHMLRILNNKQYTSQDFSQTILTKELCKGQAEVHDQREVKWSMVEKRNKETAMEIIGYDPFEGYPDADRKFLFNELIKYLDDDDIVEDQYKISQIIQIVNNNNQIRNYDALISMMSPKSDAAEIEKLIKIKKDIVSSNDKIAKENEISVKNRSNKEAGRSTLTYLMKDLREKDFEDAVTNYYNQLTSPGSQWAADMSLKAIKANTFFDENDREEIFQEQREMLTKLQRMVDDLTEENRLLKVENQQLKKV